MNVFIELLQLVGEVRPFVLKCLVKAKNFHNSKNKKGYACLLKTGGIDEKSGIILEFLEIKIAEHETLYRGDQEFAR